MSAFPGEGQYSDDDTMNCPHYDYEGHRESLESRKAKDCTINSFDRSTVDGYVRFLAWVLWRDHCRTDSPDFELLPDTIGVLSQIDNILTAWKEPSYTPNQMADNFKAGMNSLALMLTEEIAMRNSYEQFMRSRMFTKADFARNELGHYKEHYMQTYWEVWKASRTEAIETPKF